MQATTLLVEGESDRLEVETLAFRRGLRERPITAQLLEGLLIRRRSTTTVA